MCRSISNWDRPTVIPLTQDEGTFLDSQLLAAPNLAWSVSELADSPTEARIYDAAGLQVAAGVVRGPAKSANGETSVGGVIPISESLAQKPGLYKFSLYTGDREIASRSFLIGTDLVARARAEEAKAKAEEAKARAEEARARARREAEVIAKERADAAEAAAAQERARQEQVRQQALQEQQQQQQMARQHELQDEQQKAAQLQQLLNLIPR